MGACSSIPSDPDSKTKDAVHLSGKKSQDDDLMARAEHHRLIGRTSTVELCISAENMDPKDSLFFVLKIMRGGKDYWEEYARSEIIKDSEDPVWAQKIELEYHFEEEQRLAVELFSAATPRAAAPAAAPAAAAPAAGTKLLPLAWVARRGGAEWTLAQILSSRVVSERGQVVRAASAPPKETGEKEDEGRKGQQRQQQQRKRGRRRRAGGGGGGAERGPPTLVVSAKEEPGANATLRLKLRATALRSMDLVGKSDPFLRLSVWAPRGAAAAAAAAGPGGGGGADEEEEDEEDGGGGWRPVYRTEVVMNSAAPEWAAVEVAARALGGGGGARGRRVRIECLDYDRHGRHDFIGQVETTVDGLIQAAQSGAALVLGKQGGSGPTKNSQHRQPVTPDQLSISNKLAPHIQFARYQKSSKHMRPRASSSRKDEEQLLFVTEAEIEEHPSFLDYIAAGVEVSFITAIDFTMSNGDASKPDSLHFVDPSGKLNEYAQAIVSVGKVLEIYDTDKKFPVYGFGGKLAAGRPAAHCFAVNGREAAPDAHSAPGVAGIVETYYRGLQMVQLSGPTLFAQIINRAADLAAKHEKMALLEDERALATSSTQGDARGRAWSSGSAGAHHKYFVLMVLTDGGVNDLPDTLEAIVRASKLPLSVVVVGVGPGDFAGLRRLDADQGGPLVAPSGEAAVRDIVQFTPLREFKGSHEQRRSGRRAQLALARHLLAEVPNQFLGYMAMRGLAPPPRRRGGGEGDMVAGTEGPPGGSSSHQQQAAAPPP